MAPIRGVVCSPDSRRTRRRLPLGGEVDLGASRPVRVPRSAGDEGANGLRPHVGETFDHVVHHAVDLAAVEAGQATGKIGGDVLDPVGHEPAVLDVLGG